MSEDSGYDVFCTHCGYRLQEGAVFCPSCGASVEEGDSDAAMQYNGDRGTVRNGRLDSRLKTVSIIAAISSAIMMAIGLFYLIQVDVMMDVAAGDPQWSSLVEQMEREGYTEQEFKDIIRSVLVVLSSMFLVGGIMTAVGAVCGFTRKYWALGLVAFIVATLSTAMTLVGLVIGILVVYFYYTTKSCFDGN